MPTSRLPRTWRLAALLFALLPAASCGDGPALERVPPDEAHEELTRQLGRLLVDGRIEEAYEAWQRLAREHGGVGRRSGRPLPAHAVAGAFVEGALDVARGRIDGPSPDRNAAERALALATEVRERTVGLASDEALEAAERRARAWVAPHRLADLPGAGEFASHDGPRLLIYADDFLLGEPWLLSVARRWAMEGRVGGLRVGVVQIERGVVRAGVRRVAAPAAEERAAVEARLEESEVRLEPGRVDGRTARRRLGLADQAGAVLVLDRGGRIVARLAGVGLDPRPLEAAVQRAASR